MLTLDEAYRRLLERAQPTDGEPVALRDAVGRVLLEPKIVAAGNVPPFANSAMDGFALRATDAPGPLRLIGEVRSRDHHITVDGVEYDAQAAMVLVANCGEIIPPLIKLRTGISPNDGLLDVVVMRANSFMDSVRAVWDLLREGHGGDAFVGYARGREIRVESNPVIPVQLDGDAGGTTPFTATCVPGAIRIMAPAG